MKRKPKIQELVCANCYYYEPDYCHLFDFYIIDPYKVIDCDEITFTEYK